MRTGVVIGIPGSPLPDPSEIPAEVARFLPQDGPPFTWTAAYVEQLKESGRTGLAHPFYDAPWWKESLTEWLPQWAKNIDVENHEFGNEPPPHDWELYRRRLHLASPILRAEGRKVILAASVTGRTHEWLSTTPDSVWEAVDGVALHPYSRTALQVLGRVQEAREIVPKHLPLMVTEFGWSIGSQDVKYRVIDEMNQARLISATLSLLEREADSLKLKLACVFCHADYPDREPWLGKWWRTAGMTRCDGTRRPAFDALEKASKVEA